MWPASTRCRTVSPSTTAIGRGLGASRRQRPGASSVTGTPRARSRATPAASSGCPIGLVGLRRSGSWASHKVWVINVTTKRFTPARASAFWRDCWIMYPIQPAVAATSTPSGSGSNWSLARSLRSSSSPTCGPLPCTSTTRQPARAKSTTGARLSRVWRNWLAIVGRSPGGATALPPRATTIVSGRTAAEPSGARGSEQACDRS